MKPLWLKFSAKIDALALRERLVVFSAALFLALYLVFALAIEPAQRRQKLLRSQMEQQKAEVAALHTRGRLRPPGPIDPDVVNRARGNELKRQLDALDDTLKAMERDLVSADRMNPLLREMLARESGLQLIALRTLPVAPLVVRPAETGEGGGAGAPSPAKAAMGAANVYKHGVEITLQGSYSGLHDYLLRLERAPWRMFWWRGRLTAEEDLRLTMTVTIYTLSLDKAWLQV